DEKRLGGKIQDGFAAAARIDRRAVGRNLISLVLRKGWQATLPGDQYFRWHGDRRVLPVSAADPAVEGLYAWRPGARNGGGSGERSRRAGTREDGLSGLHETSAIDDARNLGRSGAVYRDVLVPVSGLVVAWRLGERRRRRLLVSAWTRRR